MPIWGLNRAVRPQLLVKKETIRTRFTTKGVKIGSKYLEIDLTTFQILSIVMVHGYT